jgi:hypothetical protein
LGDLSPYLTYALIVCNLDKLSLIFVGNYCTFFLSGVSSETSAVKCGGSLKKRQKQKDLETIL